MTELLSTPWGPAQHIRTIAPGIEVLSTASHGGVHLTGEPAAAFRRAFPLFQPFAADYTPGYQSNGAHIWLEEDLDAGLAFAFFESEFADSYPHQAQAFCCAHRSYFERRGALLPEAWFAHASEAARNPSTIE